jgi:hypothetical protein
MDTEFVDDIVLIGVKPMVDRLRVVNSELGAIVDAVQPKVAVSFEDLRKSDVEGQRKLLQVVAAVVGRLKGTNPADDETRARLLTPILEQNDEVGAMYRKRNRVTDVDPSTGDVTEPTPPVA